jgi:NifU-like protein involved in Fe-S cluster formation
MTGADATGFGSLDGHPPYVKIHLRVDGLTVKGAQFEAEGCGVTIAAASALTVLINGRTLTECLQLNSEDLTIALDGVPADKKYCLDVAVAAMHMAAQQMSTRG